jgi:sorbitol-6-phosphate 2-dehydrogenase
MMVMDTKKINQIAPLLRIILKQDGRYPLVRYAETCPSCTLSVEMNLDRPEEAASQIRKALGRVGSGGLETVCVQGVGCFQILPWPRPSEGRVAGKIVLVTGAAQGFGLEIAQDCAAQGALVVMMDINEEGVRRAAEELRSQYGPETTLPLKVDVTHEDSVMEAIHQTVRHFGGFDVLISNAGVLKADSVKRQPVKDFDFVTAVNYKGYFLCVKAASPVLAAQHKADPSYRSDIIQINSKSGLRGSNRNFAYAGSKFGGIGLTQSFAMELVEDGIKVNSVCPGNFFDGPLWSDPNNGLFVQYLRAGKVRGAKTVEDVRKAYEAMIPMGRGCTAADVMKAIYYLIEQEYETGQALPVTGGQVMLH